MSQAPAHPRDPLGVHIVLAAVFAALCYIRISIPSQPYFDEVHYLPAARELLELGVYRNREHPLLGKELIALGITIFGDNPAGWRLPSMVTGTLAILGAMRAMWFASMSRFASSAFGVLLATGFALFVHARIAMLDIFMVTFVAVAAWQFAAAIREPEHGRMRLAATGVALGCAMGAKWNAIPVAVLPGLAFFAARLAAGRRRLFTSRRGIPVPGISLIEAALWLGIVPLATYALTFLPGLYYREGAITVGGLVEHHRQMLSLQEQVLKPHPYQSTWTDWLMNWRAIWYLYEPVDGAQRGVLLIGNPLTMLLGLPALVWAAWSGLTKRNWAALGIAIGYAASLGLWIAAPKAVQFYYHYFLPSCFLLAALALALGTWWDRGYRKSAVAVLLASTVIFAWFYPVLSSAPLTSDMAFQKWMWLDSWR